MSRFPATIMRTAKSAALPMATRRSPSGSPRDTRGTVGPAEERRDRWQHDEDHDRDEVLDDEPANGGPALQV